MFTMNSDIFSPLLKALALPVVALLMASTANAGSGLQRLCDNNYIWRGLTQSENEAAFRWHRLCI